MALKIRRFTAYMLAAAMFIGGLFLVAADDPQNLLSVGQFAALKLAAIPGLFLIAGSIGLFKLLKEVRLKRERGC